MSQFYTGVTAGSLPPTVPTSFTTNNGTATPLANNIIIHGISSSSNNANGIISNGGVVGTGIQNEVDIALTNRITGSTMTSDGAGQTQTFSNFNLGSTPGTYIFTIDVVAYNITDAISASYKVFLSRRTNGAAAFGVGSDWFVDFDEGNMLNVTVTAQTVGNTFQISVTGLAGKVIDWLSVATYTFVS